MSALSEVLGGTHEFSHRGKTYTVSLITHDIELAFERKLYRKALERAEFDKKEMSSHEYQAKVQEVQSRYDVGGYALDGLSGSMAIQTVPGLISLLALCFGINDDEMKVIFRERQDECRAILNVIIKESLGHLLPDESSEGGDRKKLVVTGSPPRRRRQG